MSDIVTLNGYKIKDEKAVRSYDTIALMKADTKLKEGYHVKTKGYYEANDGGNGEYVIVDDETLVDDGGSIHVLTNGLRAKLIINDDINVKQFGAYGDGVHNDTSTLQKALNTFKKIVIENGTYLTNSLTINENQHIIGNNAILQLKDNTENNKIFNINTHDVLIENLTFKGLINDDDYTTQSTNFGIRATGNNIKIKNCKFYNFGRDGIYCYTLSNLIVEESYFEHCNTNAIAFVQQLSNIKIINNTFNNNPYQNINFEHNDPTLKVNDVMISNNTIMWNDTTAQNNSLWGINVACLSEVPSESTKYSNVLITNNYFKNIYLTIQCRLIRDIIICDNIADNCQRAIWIDSAGNSNLYQENITISRNIFNLSGTSTMGFNCLNIKNLNITENRIINSIKNHCIILVSCINNFISGNYISESEKRGISLQGFTQKTNIVNNYFKNTNGGCIYLTYAQEEPLYLTIDNNIFEDTSYDDTYLLRSTQSDRKNVVLSNFTKIVGEGVTLGLQIRTTEFDSTTCNISTNDKYTV